MARLLRESLAEESIYQLNRDGPINGDIQASDSVSQRGGAQQQQMMGAQAMGPQAIMGRMGGAAAEENKDAESVTSMRTGVSYLFMNILDMDLQHSSP